MKAARTFKTLVVSPDTQHNKSDTLIPQHKHHQHFNSHVLSLLCSLNIRDKVFFFLWLDSPVGGLGFLIFRSFVITQFRHTTLGRTSLDEVLYPYETIVKM